MSQKSYIDLDGEIHSLSEWSRITGIGITTLSNRINSLGWDAKKALTTNPDRNNEYDCDLDGEIWKPILGYEGLYEVSNLGRIKSKPRYNRNKTILLTPSLNKKQGRLSVILTDHNGYNKRVSIHRIVAMAFVENPYPEYYTEINHKDENPKNNSADNLEWCDHWYNMHYNNLHERISLPNTTVAVVGVDENGYEVHYASKCRAKKDGFDSSGIYQSIHKPRKDGTKRKYKGYYWYKENEYKQQKQR